MDKETNSRLFEPFYTTKLQGRGLGMAATYGIIKNHGCWISIDSESGEGTTVCIYLPGLDIKVKEPVKQKAESLIEEFGLQHVRKNLGKLLSGGERRRTEIARALAVDPMFVLLDEPFAGVDPIAVEEIQSIVAKLKDKNIGILITDHNVNETLSITDRAYLMFEGKLLKAGTAEELASDEQVRKVYLGKHFELKRKI
jgi:ABC-type lipopolysaccharide export system ATPase subunit